MPPIQKYDFVTGVETDTPPTPDPASAPGDLFVIGAKTQFTIVNNQSSPANVTDAVWDKATYRSVTLLVTVYRSASGGSTRAESFLILLVNDGSSWELLVTSVAVPSSGDSGMTFAVTAAGQLTYVSDDNGGSYSAATSWLKWSILDIVEAA